MNNAEEARRRKAARDRIRRKKRKRTIQLLRRIGISIIVVALLLVSVRQLTKMKQGREQDQQLAETFSRKVEEAPDFEVQLLTPNPYSRPQTALEQINGLVIHYTANPGTSAQQNHDYFEGLKDSKITKASSHFIIGIDGEIIQCIPSSEIAYASNERNADTLSIECCHMDETGEFSKETYDSLVHLTAWLCGKFDFTTEEIIRHYDVTGKKCPLYYVEHEEAWEQFLLDVQAYIEKYGVEEEETLSERRMEPERMKLEKMKPGNIEVEHG